jgi:hypothetical protein
MSYVMAVPELMAAAATDVAAVGSTLSAAHIAAAAPTVAVIPAAIDEVSASIAHLFSRYAQGYHALAAQAAAFHQQFVQHLHASASSYVTAEAANAASLLHLNAGAASSAAALPSSIVNLSTQVNVVLSNLLATLNSFLSTALPALQRGLATALNFIDLVLYLRTIISYVKYVFFDILIQFAQAILRGQLTLP